MKEYAMSIVYISSSKILIKYFHQWVTADKYAVKRTLTKMNSSLVFYPDLCPVYLRLPCIDEVSIKIDRQALHTIKSSFNGVV